MPAFYKEWGWRAFLSLKKRIVMTPQPRPAVFVGRNSTLELCNTIAHFGFKNLLIVTDKPLAELA